jgi:hypothetical protein
VGIADPHGPATRQGLGLRAGRLFKTHNLLHGALPLPGYAFYLASARRESGRRLSLTCIQQHRRAAKYTPPRSKLPEGAAGLKGRRTHCLGLPTPLSHAGGRRFKLDHLPAGPRSLFPGAAFGPCGESHRGTRTRRGAGRILTLDHYRVFKLTHYPQRCLWNLSGCPRTRHVDCGHHCPMGSGQDGPTVAVQRGNLLVPWTRHSPRPYTHNTRIRGACGGDSFLWCPLHPLCRKARQRDHRCAKSSAGVTWNRTSVWRIGSTKRDPFSWFFSFRSAFGALVATNQEVARSSRAGRTFPYGKKHIQR